MNRSHIFLLKGVPFITCWLVWILLSLETYAPSPPFFLGFAVAALFHYSLLLITKYHQGSLKLMPKGSKVLVSVCAFTFAQVFFFLTLAATSHSPWRELSHLSLFQNVIRDCLLIGVTGGIAYYVSNQVASILLQKSLRKAPLNLYHSLPTVEATFLANVLRELEIDYINLVRMDLEKKSVSPKDLPNCFGIVVDSVSAPSISERRIASFVTGNVPVFEFSEIIQDLIGRVPIHFLTKYQLISTFLTRTQSNFYVRAFELLERLLAVVLLAVLSPIAVIVALITYYDGQGKTIIYRQKRLGLNGKIFTVYKFRTMVKDAEKLTGPVWTSKNDPRITPLGRFLRATRLDELPQLFNIIKGEMSFVGPRPERPEMVEKLEQNVPFFFLRNVVKPGITGWAQTALGYVSSVEESRLKLECDLYFIKNRSLRLYAIIAIKTLLIGLLGYEKRSSIIDFQPEGTEGLVTALHLAYSKVSAESSNPS